MKSYEVRIRIFHELSRYSYDRPLKIKVYLQLAFMQNSSNYIHV